MKRFNLAAIAILLLSAYPAAAELVVDAGSWKLNPNEADQDILVTISGSGNVTNAMVMAQIVGDAPLPSFTGGNIVAGTIFAPNNTGMPSYDFSDPQLAYLDVATDSGVIAIAGTSTLAKLTVSTVGVFSGDYILKVLGTDWGDTAIGMLPAVSVTYLDGSIHVVPEPSGAIMLLIGLSVVLARYRAVPK